MFEASNRREAFRIPVHKQGRLRFVMEYANTSRSVELPVMVREVAPGGVSFVLDEGEMPRNGLAAIVSRLDVERGDTFELDVVLGERDVVLEGVVSWCQITGGEILPVRWTIGINIANTSPMMRQLLGNWVFIAKDALHEALCYAQRGDWEDTRLLLDDLGLSDLPPEVLGAILDEYVLRADKTPMASDLTTLPFEASH